ncbi:hypothetical protein Nizo2484_1725 [Lactiplantibacillus plantarum]|nr:hypothetical protein Nizo2484_1725 [Lactiplantibacillus plantarum]
MTLIWCVAFNCWTVHGCKLLCCRPSPVCHFTRNGICRDSPCKRNRLGHIVIMGCGPIRINVMNRFIDRFAFRCHGWIILSVHDGKLKVTGITGNSLRTNLTLIWCVAFNCWTIHGRKLLRCRPGPVCLFTRNGICRDSPRKRDGLRHIIIVSCGAIRINIMNRLIDRFTFRCHGWGILSVHDGKFKITGITSNGLRCYMLQI